MGDSARDPHVDAATLVHLAYAEASIMLLESLLLLLIDRRVVSLEAIVEAVDATIETKLGFVRENNHPDISRVAAGILVGITNSVTASRPVKPSLD